jgi:hypothetical protein
MFVSAFRTSFSLSDGQKLEKALQFLTSCSFGLSATNIFLSEQTSNQPVVLFSQNKSVPAISYRPN